MENAMQDFEKKVFDSINRGYINLTRFGESKIASDVDNIKTKGKEEFIEDFRLFLSSFNYMGMDDVVAKHFVHCILANKPKSCLVFVQYITLLAVAIKEEDIYSDARSKASIDFLSSNVSSLESVVAGNIPKEKKEIIKSLMLDVAGSTHRTIFQSFIRTLSLSAKKLINENKIERIVKSEEDYPIKTFFTVFADEDAYFPFI